MQNKTEPQSKSLIRYLPILVWLPSYQRTWLRPDLIAGLDGRSAADPGGHGLRPDRRRAPPGRVLRRPDRPCWHSPSSAPRASSWWRASAAIATMSFATVSLIAAPDTTRIHPADGRARRCWPVLVADPGRELLKLGRVAQFFSELVMVGFITGLALVIMVKQLPKLLGIEAGSRQLLGAALRRRYPPARNALGPR